MLYKYIENDKDNYFKITCFLLQRVFIDTI